MQGLGVIGSMGGNFKLWNQLGLSLNLALPRMSYVILSKSFPLSMAFVLGK